MIRILLLLTVLLPLCCPLAAQAPAMPRLAAAVDALNRDPDMQGASWSLTVLDAATGAELLSQDPHRNLATASTMKVLTTATALAVLGADYRFPTRLAYSGSLREGVLTGDLYVQGSGDPSLGSDRFGEAGLPSQLLHDWSGRIQAAGIREIRGRIIGDDRYFSTQITPGEWPWEDMGNYYGAGASGLNYRENYYRLDLKPGPQAGAATQVLRTEPALPEIRFVNELLTGAPGSGDQAYIYGAPYTALRYLRGTIPAGRSVFSIKGSLPDPAHLLATDLQEELAACGITTSGGATTTRRLIQAGENLPAGLTPVHTHLSPPLHELVRETNMESLNLYAEALARAAAVARGEVGASEPAMALIQAYWQQQGVATDRMYLRDGAGLAPGNALSTYQLAQVLVKARRAPYGEALYASLPVAGRSGTLKGMLKGTAAEGRLRAKSGYIAGVRGYAGYVTTVEGRELAFVMLANYYSCSAAAMRRKFETLMVRLAEGK